MRTREKERYMRRTRGHVTIEDDSRGIGERESERYGDEGMLG